MKSKVVGNEQLHSSERQKLRGETTSFPFREIREITKEANDTIFGFNLLGIIDQDFPQIFRYTEGDYYDYHVEINPYAVSRKLSFVINLSDASDYEGGELEFLNTDTTNTIANKKGTIVIFPSFMPYRINKVISGTKQIVIGHIHGEIFK